MPIRLNLLAEAQAADDARRRDPVKRATWVAGFVVIALIAWSASLQLKAMFIHSDVSRLEGRINSQASQYQLALDQQNKAADLKHRLAALQNLSASRLLSGTLLNGLQQTIVSDVQLLRLRLDQSYVAFEGTKTRTNENNVLIKGKPATATERVLLTLEGADSSPNPGDGLNKYKDELAANAYFSQVLLKTNGISLKSLAPPQISSLTGKRTVIFTLECRYPEKTR